jgi:hypothetical protein
MERDWGWDRAKDKGMDKAGVLSSPFSLTSYQP